MHKLIAAFVLAAAMPCAFAADPQATTPAPDLAPAPTETADQAALEVDDREPEHEGPTWGQSRVERYREKCGAIADQQGLKGAARQKHMRSCVKR